MDQRDTRGKQEWELLCNTCPQLMWYFWSPKKAELCEKCMKCPETPTCSVTCHNIIMFQVWGKCQKNHRWPWRTDGRTDRQQTKFPSSETGTGLINKPELAHSLCGYIIKITKLLNTNIIIIKNYIWAIVGLIEAMIVKLHVKFTNTDYIVGL